MAEFTGLSTGMVKELGIRRDGKWASVLPRAAPRYRRKREFLLERAPKDVVAALPQPKAGLGLGSKPLDFTRMPNEDRIARARRAAYLIGRSRPFAVAASFNANLGAAHEEAGATLRSRGENLLRDLRRRQRGNARACGTLLALLFDLSQHVPSTS